MIADAILWIRKYIIIPSDRNGFFVSDIIGMKDIKLISSPIHMFIQFLDLKIINVLVNVIVINNVLEEVLIKKKKIRLL